MREIRRPKPEIRKKPEIGNLSLRGSARADSDRGPRATEDGSAFEGAGASECNESEPRLLAAKLAPSGFGLRISLGFRASDFELWPPACSTHNSKEPLLFLRFLDERTPDTARATDSDF